MPVLQLGVVELEVALMAAECTELATRRAEQPRRDLVTILCLVWVWRLGTGRGENGVRCFSAQGFISSWAPASWLSRHQGRAGGKLSPPAHNENRFYSNK